MLTKTLSFERNRPDDSDEHGEQRRGEQKLDLQRPAPVAAEEANDSSRPRRPPAGRRRTEAAPSSGRPTLRDMCISIVQPVLRAVEMATNGMTSRLATPRATQMSGSSRRIQHRVGVEEEIEGEDAGQPDAQRLDAPARLRMRAPQQLLDEDQPDDREPEPEPELDECAPSCPVDGASGEPVRKRDAGDAVPRDDRDRGPARQQPRRLGGDRARRAAREQAREEREPDRVAQRVERVRREPRHVRRPTSPTRQRRRPPRAPWRAMPRAAASPAALRRQPSASRTANARKPTAARP